MMKTTKIGLIGGSGLYKLDKVRIVKEHKVSTPYGEPSSTVLEAELDGKSFYFLPRHGKTHHLLPHEVNYRANIYAMKQMGIRYLISISAVGSLKEELHPGLMVIPDQFIDWTKGKRERSFFGEGVVAHVSVAEPINSKLSLLLNKACDQASVKCSLGGSYICIEGPQFSTKAESAIFRSFGASIIGMTNVPEAYLAKEAGIAYATLGMVTDYDCWKEEHCTLPEIMKVMEQNNLCAQKVISKLIPLLSGDLFDFDVESSLLTPLNQIKEERRKILDVILN